LKDIKEAGTIRLKETSANTPLPSTSGSSHEKNKRRHWLELLLRESLGMPFVVESLSMT
jgi:hypothetical protein